MEELTFVPLQTENHCIIIPTKNVQIDVLCKTHKILEIKQPSLISSKTGCIITYDRSIMKIGGIYKNISYEIKIKNSSHSVKEIDIPTLEEILKTAPKVTHNFNQYKANLDTLQTQANSLQFERHINSLREYGISALQMLGYVALELGTVYILYKCKLFECLSQVIPKNVCIRIFCPIAHVNNMHQAPTTPILSSAHGTVTFQNITENEDNGIIQIRRPTRAIRFNRAKRI